MRWPGVPACLAGFHEVERSGALGRLRAPRLGAVPPLSFVSAARWGLRVGAGPTVSGAEWNAVKSRRVRRWLPWGPAKGREFCGGLPRLSGRSLKRQESRNSRRLAGGVGFLFAGLLSA